MKSLFAIFGIAIALALASDGKACDVNAFSSICGGQQVVLGNSYGGCGVQGFAAPYRQQFFAQQQFGYAQPQVVVVQQRRNFGILDFIGGRRGFFDRRDFDHGRGRRGFRR